ncbi:hypothetical protein PSP31121_05338 [Pandoraea sputorum]|uniref:Uncharacterized protein n=1 Tax=Pandoraea sputorum TaxID=93222 RepID=A0A5E5BMV7_9BURK|nr:hypothetical protein PSP31121_05338 [Pandoraea sputorum]
MPAQQEAGAPRGLGGPRPSRARARRNPPSRVPLELRCPPHGRRDFTDMSSGMRQARDAAVLARIAECLAQPLRSRRGPRRVKLQSNEAIQPCRHGNGSGSNRPCLIGCAGAPVSGVHVAFGHHREVPVHPATQWGSDVSDGAQVLDSGGTVRPFLTPALSACWRERRQRIHRPGGRRANGLVQRCLGGVRPSTVTCDGSRHAEMVGKCEGEADLPDFFGPFQPWNMTSASSVEQPRC